MADYHADNAHTNESRDAHPDAVDAGAYNNGIDILVQNGYDAREEMLTLADAARRAGVTRSAVLRWIRSGYLLAETSNDGWMIHAEHLESAREADERSRLGIGMDQIAHEPVNTNRVDTISSVALRTFPAPRSIEPLSDSLVSPLAELIRDQTDVVQDQAETIGWLQSELRQMREHLSELEAASASEDVEDATEGMDPAADVYPDPSFDEADTTAQQERIADTLDHFDTLFGEPPAQASGQGLVDFKIDLSTVDIFSDEAARARMAIEETERKINELWREQGLQAEIAASFPDPEPVEPEQAEAERSWLQRMFTPWKRS